MIKASGVSDETQHKALGFLETKVTLEETNADALGEHERVGTYRAACKLMTVDRRVDPQERAFLERLSKMLGIDADRAAEIEKSRGV